MAIPMHWGSIMLRWLVSVVFACAFLLGGAVITMEAMGLIFLAASDDPEQRMEAVVAQIDASVDPRDVPTEAEAEGLWPPPEKQAEEPAPESAKGDKATLIPADLAGAGPPAATAVAAAGTAPVVAAETEAELDAVDPTPPAPKLVAVGKTADPAPEPIRETKACTGTCSPTKALAPKRARPSRADDHVSWLASVWSAASLP
jgi:hypothetical protein